jgi:DNA-binding transcriptional MerR regulator
MRIAQLADALNVSQSTIRSWELRYGMLGIERTPGGQRDFEEAYVEALMQAQAEGRGGGDMVQRANALHGAGKAEREMQAFMLQLERRQSVLSRELLKALKRIESLEAIV